MSCIVLEEFFTVHDDESDFGISCILCRLMHRDAFGALTRVLPRQRNGYCTALCKNIVRSALSDLLVMLKVFHHTQHHSVLKVDCTKLNLFEKISVESSIILFVVFYTVLMPSVTRPPR